MFKVESSNILLGQPKFYDNNPIYISDDSELTNSSNDNSSHNSLEFGFSTPFSSVEETNEHPINFMNSWKNLLNKHKQKCNLWVCEWCVGKNKNGNINKIKSYT